MTYNHLTISELSFIQNFWNQGVKTYIVAKTLKRSAETIYRVFRFLDAGYSISEYYENYRANKSRSGRKPIVLPNDELEYIKEKVSLGRALLELHQDYPNYHNEFGHLEADTIQGKNHRGAVMTLVERKSKAVIILNTRHKTDKAIFEKLDALLSVTPKGLLNRSLLIMVRNFLSGKISLISMISVPTLPM